MGRPNNQPVNPPRKQPKPAKVTLEHLHEHLLILRASVARTEQNQQHSHQLLHDIKQQGASIMTAISDFAVKQRTHNDKISTALDGIASDIASMKALIEQLQNSPGPISAEDQATLDELEAAASTAADKAEALDNLTPPTPPAG